MKRSREQSTAPQISSSITTLRCFPCCCLPLNSCVNWKDEATLLPHPNNLHNLPNCFSFIILYWFSSSFLNLPPALSSHESFSPLSLSLRLSLFPSLTHGHTHTHTYTYSPADVATPNRFTALSIWSTALLYFLYNTSQSCMLMVSCFADCACVECIVWFGYCPKYKVLQLALPDNSQCLTAKL